MSEIDLLTEIRDLLRVLVALKGGSEDERVAREDLASKDVVKE